MCLTRKIAAVVLLSVLCTATVTAAEKYAVGIQGGVLGYGGVSGKMVLDKDWTAQAILGGSAGVAGLTGRGLYELLDEEIYRVYGIGEAGLGYGGGNAKFGVGVGAGIEANWQHLVKDVIPLWWSGEGGVKYVVGSIPIPMIEIGIHYKFD